MARKRKPKQAPKKNSGKSSKARSRIASFIHSYAYLFLQISAIVLLCSIAYIFWLDHRVTSEFEGKRWSLPARVYARPLELYAGAEINSEQLLDVLNTLGYQNVGTLYGPGQYQKSDNTIQFISRVFEFWDNQEQSKKIRLGFSDSSIQSITDASSGKLISVFRLEPELIAKIYPEHNEDRVLVDYNDVPLFLVDALIAVEDRNFYRHNGIDFKGIFRALITNLSSGGLRQGGSTLTQQLVKNYFLTSERTFSRKINEVIMALLLEQHYSKAEILSAYINEIYLGQHGARGVHGFGTAAEFYFSRPLNELKPEEIALLVALVRGASFYNPRSHPDRALKRRNLTISLMQEQGYMSENDANKLTSRPLRISKKPSWSGAKYPAFTDLVRRQLLRDYKNEDLRTEGLRIFTTLNSRYQEILEQKIARRLLNLENQKQLTPGTLQSAAVITSVETGEVLALTGGRNNASNDFNRALDAVRPIGSLVKPAVYLTAIMQPEKYHSLTLLEDKPIKLKQHDGTFWQPKNYDEITHGDIALHTALSKSYNLATINLGMNLGLPAVIKTLQALGVKQNIPAYPSLLLGALDLSPFQVTQMYQTLASGGFQVPLKTIKEVLDKNGQPLNRYGLDIKQTLDANSVFITRYLLSEVVNSGTAKSITARLPDLLPLAGKTGTTNELRDSWFAGFGDNVLGVIWVGRDDNQPSRLTGASGALQVWIDIMQSLRPQPLSFITPDGVQWAKVLYDKRVADDCEDAMSYPFIRSYIPAHSGTCQNGFFKDMPFFNGRKSGVKTENQDDETKTIINRHFNIH